MQKIDPHTQKPIIGKDGKPVTEEKEVTIPAYKVVSVFDVSQTEGKELPDIAVDELTGDVDRYKDFFAALEKTSPVPIAFENIEGGSHGYYHLEDKRIAINEGMSELQTLKTAIHEIAHTVLHNEACDTHRELRRHRAKEVTFSDMTLDEARQLHTFDEYFKRETVETVFEKAGKKITPKLLLEAIRTLPEEKRKAILLYYFEGMNDTEIAELFNTSRSTIQYRRTSSFERLRKYLEENADEWDEW